MANFRNQPRPGIARRNAIPARRKGRNNIRLIKRVLRFAMMFALAGLAWMGWERIPAQELRTLFPINYVRVAGEVENLDVGKLQDALQPTLSGGYFNQDLGEIEGVIHSFAWIDQVRLSRIWPDTLEVDITEQKAVARWGDRALLNPRGERFAPDGVEAYANLPVIYGPLGMESFLLDTLNALNDRLAAKGVKVATLDMSKRRAWIVRLDNGLELHFGRQDPVKVLERFLGLAPKLGEDVFAQLKRVDLRYPNGFALVWKSADEINGEGGAMLQLNGKASNLAE
ncbi:MAG: cell division protein FtsQ/DivIB [Candidatus Methylumidiphilus sp.]